MYCVRCGVRLEEGVKACPLCDTPVWDPEGNDPSKTSEKNYPDTLPRIYRESRIPIVIAITVLCAIAAAVVMSVCFGLYGELKWGGYVMCGIALFYVVFVLPFWFTRPRAEVFVPVTHAAVGAYVLYICLKTGGRWFLSFAFPILGIGCLFTTAVICVLKYVKRGRLFIFGGFLILLGGFTMLVEFFEHITFKTPMFSWSLFSVSGFAAAGLFLMVVATIKPLRHALEKKFFF